MPPHVGQELAAGAGWSCYPNKNQTAPAATSVITKRSRNCFRSTGESGFLRLRLSFSSGLVAICQSRTMIKAPIPSAIHTAVITVPHADGLSEESLQTKS